eukprot:symbB.v1.2.027197.t1/scaffold2716.1/size72468/4
MMMSLLFLGLTLAEAKLNKLNQTLSSTRRMALSDFPAECSSACTGISQAYDETICLAQLVATAPDPLQGAIVGTADGMGLICQHREAYECGATSNDCSSVLSSFTGGISAFVSSLDCICDACPNAKLVFAHQAEVAVWYTQCLTAILTGSGTQDCSTDLEDHLGAICPMITTIECLTSEAACGALSSQLVLNELSDLKSECQARQVPVDYLVNYTYTDACVTLSETSSTVGLLQLKLLALGCSLLLSILVE